MNDQDPNRQHLGTYKSTLECELNDAERAEYARQLAHVEDEWQAYLEKKKSQNAALNAEKARLEADRANLARKVKTGREHREVGCTITAIFDRNVAVTSRDDTGEVISERALKAEERQKVLNLQKADDAVSAVDKLLTDAKKAANEPCTAVVLAGLCTVHGSECPNPETFPDRVAKTKDGAEHPLNHPKTDEAPKTDE